MQWSLGLASLLWVWQFPHYLLPFSFSRAVLLHFGWPSRISLLRLWYNTGYWSCWISFQVYALFKGLLTGFLTLLHSSFWLFSLLPRTVYFFHAWNLYYVLLSLLGVFPSTFFSNASVIVPFNCLPMIFWLRRMQFPFQFVDSCFIIGCSSFVIRWCGSCLLHIYPWLLGLVQDRVNLTRLLQMLICCFLLVYFNLISLAYEGLCNQTTLSLSLVSLYGTFSRSS